MAVSKRISKCRDDKPRFRIFDRLREQETEDRPFTEIVPEWLKSLSDCEYTSTNEQHTPQDKVNPSARASHPLPPAIVDQLSLKRKAEPEELEEPNREHNPKVRRPRRPLYNIHFSPRQPPTPHENRPSQSPFPKQSARLRARQNKSTPKMSIPIRQRKGDKITQSTSQNVDQADEAPIEGSLTRARARNNASDKENRGGGESSESSKSGGLSLGTIPVFAPPLSSNVLSPTKRSSRVRPPSPEKSTSTSTKASVTLTKRNRMAFLTPPVSFHDTDAIQNKSKLPEAVRSLCTEYLHSHERPFIPTKLKDKVQAVLVTPLKSKKSISDAAFGSAIANYRGTDPQLLWFTIQDVVQQAAQYRNSGCTEAHWTSVVISPLLNLVRRMERFQAEGMGLKVLDVSYINTSPSSLCTYDSNNQFSDLAKKIDMAVGLRLSEEEEEQLERGEYNLKGCVPSINQTSSFVNFTPMFLNIEIKMPDTDKDPLIQLGAWIVAEFEKRKIEDYTLDMPVLAIAITGDQWDLHVVYADMQKGKGKEYRVKFIGPFEMGSTRSIQGCFKILDWLCCCANWGVKVYRKWFEDEILAMYKPETESE